MSKKEIILKKDTNAIASKINDCNRSLEQMQSFINWFNELHYVTPITGIDQAKEFLSSTKSYHDQEVVKFLQSKQDVLPPNLQPLRDSWNISNCDEVDFSKGNPRFEHLQLQDSQLQYEQSVYNAIEAECTIVATPEQAAALKELDRIWANLQSIAEILYQKGIFRDQFISECRSLLGLFHRLPFGKPDGTLIQWEIKKLEQLAAGGFGQTKSIN